MGAADSDAWMTVYLGRPTLAQPTLRNVAVTTSVSPTRGVTLSATRSNATVCVVQVGTVGSARGSAGLADATTRGEAGSPTHAANPRKHRPSSRRPKHQVFFIQAPHRAPSRCAAAGAVRRRRSSPAHTLAPAPPARAPVRSPPVGVGHLPPDGRIRSRDSHRTRSLLAA